MTEQAAAPATDTSREPLTIHQAVAMLDARDAAAKATPAPATAEERPAAIASTDTAEEAPEDEAGEVEQEPAAEETEQPETEQEADPEGDDETLVALPDGKEVPLAELVKGYFRQSDYTRKTQALAEERKTFDAAQRQYADKVQQVEQVLSARVAELEAAAKARDQYTQWANLLEAKLNEQGNQLAQVNWQGMLQNIQALEAQGLDYEANKATREYNQLWAKYQLHERALQATAAEKAKTQAEREAEEAKRRNEAEARLAHEYETRKAEAMKHWETKYPDIVDAQKAPKIVNDLLETAKVLGYTVEDVQQTLDPRGIDLWWMATQWRLSRTAAKNVTQQTAQKPAAPPSGVRIIKGNAPRPRPLTVERGRLGGVQAAFNANPSFENALALENAKTAYRAKQRPR